jgi:3-hydroxybutyryl-CoA dehydratase
MSGKRFDEMQIGDSATFSKTISEADVYAFAGVTGDFNPVHINAEAAKESMFKQRIAHGMLGAGLISTILGTQLPGPGTVYLGQELAFKAPVFFGDTLTAECTVTEKKEGKFILRLNSVVRNQKGDEVITGTATVMKKD